GDRWERGIGGRADLYRVPRRHPEVAARVDKPVDEDRVVVGCGGAVSVLAVDHVDIAGGGIDGNVVDAALERVHPAEGEVILILVPDRDGGAPGVAVQGPVGPRVSRAVQVEGDIAR